MEAMIKEIKGLPISDATARLIAALRGLQEVYDGAFDVMERMYGEDGAEIIINNKLGASHEMMKKGLQDCIMMSIEESLRKRTLKEI